MGVFAQATDLEKFVEKGAARRSLGGLPPVGGNLSQTIQVRELGPTVPLGPKLSAESCIESRSPGKFQPDSVDPH